MFDKAMLEKWLNEDGHKIGKVDVQGNPPPTWSTAVMYSPAGFDQRQKKIGVVFVYHGTAQKLDVIVDGNLSPEHQKAMNSTSVFAQSAVQEIRKRILLEGIGLSFNANNGSLVGFRLDDVIYDDGPISKDAVMRILRRLYAIFLFTSDVMSNAARPQALLGPDV